MNGPETYSFRGRNRSGTASMGTISLEAADLPGWVEDLYRKRWQWLEVAPGRDIPKSGTELAGQIWWPPELKKRIWWAEGGESR